ncbi:uncharacterized protein TNIN_175831 [Trichonephila inaurata madagascariensis]|uniref:Uncharacterized protein n=1 Tax=Trichonephila inaurata madagascariensis TaxID=2747483 RepID=A0A8X6X866_9ARAC|nr:uncharacterized protein TNIN_175831 [Trichonephila inaurata madagascariensis]
MPLSYEDFLEEIARYKHLHGLARNDDEYRKNFWLPYLPINYKELKLKKLRQNWIPTKPEKKRKCIGPGKPVPKALAHFEKPTRCLYKGSICGVTDPVPRYINRGPTVASEFQGARISSSFNMGPFYPRYIPERIGGYLRRGFKRSHRECVPVSKTSATLWRDRINADLDNKSISGVPRFYHPLVASGLERLESRWPMCKKLLLPEEYFKEYCQLHNQPSSVFVLDWIDEQLALPYTDHIKEMIGNLILKAISLEKT